uniref:Uncharacterized protein n=1 Tax=Cucumis sativus TaxID=3659 RepID=A0A0A0LYQ9_CUCSA
MVAASASETQAFRTLFKISPLIALFSLFLNPSPTSNCTPNFATQLANGCFSKNLFSPALPVTSLLSSAVCFPSPIKSPPNSDLCNSTSLSIKSCSSIASTVSLRPKYPISTMQSMAKTLICRSAQFNKLIIFGISPFDSISSTNGDLINLIKEQRIFNE